MLSFTVRYIIGATPSSNLRTSRATPRVVSSRFSTMTTKMKSTMIAPA